MSIDPATEKQRSRYVKNSMKEHAAGVPQRAYSIVEFCAAYNLSRSLAYLEVGAGRLRVRKVGRRTLIAAEDAENWFASLAGAA